MYIENIDEGYLDTSYEASTQNLTQDTSTTNIDFGNIFGVLLDNALDLLSDAYDPSSGSNTLVVAPKEPLCQSPNTLVNGVCTPPEDTTKKYLRWGIGAAVVVIISYILYKKYGK